MGLYDKMDNLPGPFQVLEDMKHVIYRGGGFLTLQSGEWPGDDAKSSWKLRVSAAEDQVEKAWDIVADELMKDDVGHYAKVVDSRLIKEYADEASGQAGKMITIYTNKNVSPEHYKDVMERIEQRLADNGIGRGLKVKGDKPVAGSDYISYRNDKNMNGEYIASGQVDELPDSQRYNPSGRTDPYQDFEIKKSSPGMSRHQNPDMASTPMKPVGSVNIETEAPKQSVEIPERNRLNNPVNSKDVLILTPEENADLQRQIAAAKKPHQPVTDTVNEAHRSGDATITSSEDNAEWRREIEDAQKPRQSVTDKVNEAYKNGNAIMLSPEENAEWRREIENAEKPHQSVMDKVNEAHKNGNALMLSPEESAQLRAEAELERSKGAGKAVDAAADAIGNGAPKGMLGRAADAIGGLGKKGNMVIGGVAGGVAGGLRLLGGGSLEDAALDVAGGIVPGAETARVAMDGGDEEAISDMATVEAVSEGASILGGIGAGAAVGAAMTGPFAPVGAIVGGAIGGIGAGWAAEKVTTDMVDGDENDGWIARNLKDGYGYFFDDDEEPEVQVEEPEIQPEIQVEENDIQANMRAAGVTNFVEERPQNHVEISPEEQPDYIDPATIMSVEPEPMVSAMSEDSMFYSSEEPVMSGMESEDPDMSKFYTSDTPTNHVEISPEEQPDYVSAEPTVSTPSV